MDKNIDNQTQVNELLWRVSYKKILVLVTIIIVIFSVYLLFVKKTSQEKEVIQTSSFIPKKIDFQNTAPSGFAQVVPIEKNSTFSESYIKEYQNQTQSSVVFSSEKIL